MANALLPAEPTQTPQGGGARFFRRLGGAVRGAIAGSIEIMTGRRTPAEPKTSRLPPKPRDKAAPAAPNRPRRPRAAAPAPAAKPRGWLARWFGARPPQPEQAAVDQARMPTTRRRRREKDPLFTPETHPGLTEEDCAFLNTPIEDCDPEKLLAIVRALSQGIAAVVGPRLGMDADTLFSTFCQGMYISPDAAAPDAPPNGEPAPAPDAPQPAATDAPDELPVPPLHTPASEPTGETAPFAPAQAPRPGAIVLSGSVPRHRMPFSGGRPFQRRRPPARQCRSRLRHGSCDRQRSALPARRLCYAACAGPP